MKKRVLALFLAVAMLVTTTPPILVVEAAQEQEKTVDSTIVAEGTDGNLKWVLHDYGELTISGNGAMINYNGSNETPWYEYCHEITDVVIIEGVTSIGDYAFKNFTSLTSIIIPDSVSYIGEEAFRMCDNLQIVNIPNGVTSIGAYAFQYCGCLTRVNIPEGVSLIRNGTFSGCENLKSVNIPDNVTAIEDNAFSYCSLTNVTFGSGLNNLSSNIFSYCSKLEIMTFTGTTVPIINNHTTAVSSSSDSICSFFSRSTVSNLKTIQVPASAYQAYVDAWGEYIPSNVSFVPLSDYEETIPIVVGGTSGNLRWVLYDNGELNFSGSGAMANYNDASYAPWHDYSEAITSVVIEDGATSIGDVAFEDLTSLTSIIIPDSVTTIGCDAFLGCSSLTSVNIPNRVTRIGTGAFAGCRRLMNVDIPDAVTTIEDSVFFNCSRLTSVTIPNGVTSIGNFAFFNCGMLMNVNIPESVTSIGTDAFEECTRLTSVNIPESVTSIGSSAFLDCSNLTSVNIPDGVSSIKEYTFLGCNSLTSVNIPDSVTSIGESAFRYCSSMTNITFGSGLKNLYVHIVDESDYMFYDCFKLETMTFTGTTVPVINDDISAVNSNLDYIRGFFSRSTVSSLKTIEVPASAYQAYVDAWGDYIPSTVVIVPDFSVNSTISLIKGNCTSRTISFSWRKINRAEGYHIYRDGELIDTTTGTTYTDSNLVVGSSHTYAVTAYSGELETTKEEYTFSTVLPTVSSVYTEVPGLMDAEHNVFYAKVPNEGNLEDGKGEFIINGQRISAKSSVDKDNAVFTADWDISPETVPEGKYTVTFTFTDADGSFASRNAEIEVSYLVPSPIREVSVFGDTHQVVVSWEISAEALTTAYLVYRAEGDGDYELVKTIEDRNTLSYVDKDVTENSTYHYYVLGRTALGVTGLVDDARVIDAVAHSDTELPTVNALTPADNTRVNKTVSIKAFASDNIGVTKVELYYASNGDHTTDPTNEWTLLYTAKDESASVSLDTTLFEDGNLYIKALAYDAAGNVSDPMYRLYVVDNTGPSKVTGLTVKKQNDVSVNLTWNDVDDIDRVGFRVEQKVDGEFVQVADVTTIGAKITDLTPGETYVFRVRAVDQLGNEGEASNELTVTMYNDTTAPVVTEILPDSSVYGDSLPLKITAVDDSAITMISILYSTDKNTWKDYDAVEFDGTEKEVSAMLDVDLKHFAEGKICFGAVAYDAAGNASASISDVTPYVEYMVDHTAPAEPRDLTVVSRMGEIELNWTQGTENDLKGYNIYRSDKDGDDDSFEKLAGPLKTINYLDYNVKADTTYWYKLSAVDNAGNESLLTEAASAEAVVDTEAPYIADYSPKTEYLGSSSDIMFGVNAKDNWKVIHVSIEYQINGGSVLNASSKDFDANSVTASAKLPVANMKDGDILTVIVTVTDAQGLNFEQDYTYIIDKTAPAVNGLSASGNGTSITLTWDKGNEADLDCYQVYRGNALLAEVKEGSYTDTTIEPRKLYTYRVVAMDKCGNAAEAVLKDVRSAPVYAILNCEAAMIVNTEYTFDARESSAATSVKSYTYDFGDGTTASGSSARHIYTEEGTYTVKLTVTDAEGNTDEVSREVTVGQHASIGKINIKIADADGKSLGGASVYFDYDNGMDNEKRTDANGLASFTAVSGRHTVGVYYNSRYLPVKKTITVLPGAESDVTITLSEQEIVTGEFAVERAKLDELKDRYDIDPKAPENQDYIATEVNLIFGKEAVKMVVVSDGWSNFNYNEVKKYFYEDRELVPIYVPTEGENESGFVAVLDIPVNATYTKEFFDVKLYIINNASADFHMANNVVELHVKKYDAKTGTISTEEATGLTLIESPATCSGKTVTFGELAGQETQKLEWLFRGDEIGYYDITADYRGQLVEFGKEITATFQTNDPVHVYGSEALNLDVDIVGHVTDHKVTFTLKLKNVTKDATVTLPSFEILDGIVEASKRRIEDDGTLTTEEIWETYPKLDKEYLLSADGESKTDVSEVQELKPGQAYCKEYTVEIGSETAAYARHLQAVVKEVAKDASGLKTNIYVDGIEAEHRFVNYYSDDNAECFADGTKTAECDNNCGKSWTEVDLGSKDKKAHHFVDGICVKEGEDPVTHTHKKCTEELNFKVEFLTHTGNPYGVKTYHVKDTSASDIEVAEAEALNAYDFKGWELNGTVYSEDTIAEAIFAEFSKEYTIIGNTATMRVAPVYEISSAWGISITSQPENNEGMVGDTAVFSVKADGEDLKYQWYYSTNHGNTWAKCTNAGNNTDTLEVEIKTYRHGYMYRCEISNALGNSVTSEAAELILKDIGIVITKQPENYEGAVLDEPEFTVEAEGNGLSYQWYVSQDDGVNWAKSYTTGYNTNTLHPVLRTYRDGNQYYCEITDALGNKINSDPATMSVESSEIVITKEPEDVIGAYQELYHFHVEAEGVNLTYQWYVSQDNGESWAKSGLEGYNTDTLNVRLYPYRDSYMYRCEVTSGLKTVVTTREATLRLKESTVMLISSPKNVNCVPDSTVAFTVEVTGENLSYHWYVSQDGGETWATSGLEGYNTDTLTVKAFKYRSGFMYRCTITDESGKSVVSGAATLTVNSATVELLSQPEDVAVNVNEDTQFHVEASGDGLMYQWYVSQNGGESWSKTGLTGNTTDTLTVTAYAYRDGNMYRCEITDDSGTKVLSDAATLSVSK